MGLRKWGEEGLRRNLHEQRSWYTLNAGILEFVKKKATPSQLSILEFVPESYGLMNTVYKPMTAKILIPPVITRLSRGEVAPGDPISVYGARFLGFKRVLVSGIPAPDAVLKDTTEIQLTIPKDAKTGKLRVETAEGFAETDIAIWQGACDNLLIIRAFFALYGRGPLGDGKKGECDTAHYGKVKNMQNVGEIMQFLLTIHPKIPFPPSIDSITPNYGVPGARIQVKGKNLYSVDSAMVDGWDARVTHTDNTALAFTIPEGVSAGPVDIQLWSSQQTTTPPKRFVIAGDPIIRKMTPAAAKPGQDLTIDGLYFHNLKEVSFSASAGGAKSTATVKSATPTRIVVGGLKQDGKYTVTVVTEYGRGSAGALYTVGTPQPSITSIEPDGDQFGAEAVVLGQNFVDVTGVTFRGATVQPISVTPTMILLPIQWGFDAGKVEVKTAWGTASAEIISNREQVTGNFFEGAGEYCFPAVGNACKGIAGDNWITGDSHLLTLPFGCGKEQDGKRQCWVVPGSIEHDNCCLRFPGGKMCGGRGIDGQPAKDNNHDGHCVTEWDHAADDTFWHRGFKMTFDVRVPADLTPVFSDRYTLDYKEPRPDRPGEVNGSINVCAEGGTRMAAHYNAKFCCSRSYRMNTGRQQDKNMTYECESSAAGARTVQGNGNDMMSRLQQKNAALPPPPPWPYNAALDGSSSSSSSRGNIQPRTIDPRDTRPAVSASSMSSKKSSVSSMSSKKSSSSSIWYCSDALPLYQQQGCTQRPETPRAAPTREECDAIQFTYMKRERGCPVD